MKIPDGAPRCFGEYDEDSDACDKCNYVDACENNSDDAPKKKRRKKNPKSTEDDELIALFKSSIEDESTSLVRMRRQAIEDGDTALARILSIQLVEILKAKREALQNKSKDGEGSKLETMLLKSTIDRMSKDPVDSTLKIIEKTSALGARSDVEAITGVIGDSVKEFTGTVKEVFGRKRLGQALTDEKNAEDWSKCGQCQQLIHHPNPVSCPHCGATGGGEQHSQAERELMEENLGPEEIVEPVEDEEEEDCSGRYDADEEECVKCSDVEKCKKLTMSKATKKETVKKVTHEPLSEGAHDILDDIHRICEWVEDDVDGAKNTATLYNLGIGRRVRKGRKPKPKDWNSFKWSLFTAEVGMEKLLEVAKQWEGHPDAAEYEIGKMIDVLSSNKGKGFINASWSKLQALAKQDDVELTDEERQAMVEELNKFSPNVKLDAINYMSNLQKKTPAPPKKKAGKKKAGKKGKKGTAAKEYNTTCPICKEKMLVSELEAHLKKDHPKGEKK